MKTILTHLFTGKDGATFDLGRVLWMKMAAAYVVISGWHIVHGGAFDPMTWATGASAILAGGGVAVKVKESTEPG